MLANDSDPNGDTLSILTYEPPEFGTLTQIGNSFSYTPDPGFSGQDSFLYFADDGDGGVRGATVNLTVHSQDVAPAEPREEPEDVFVTDFPEPVLELLPDQPLAPDSMYFASFYALDPSVGDLSSVDFTAPADGIALVDELDHFEEQDSFWAGGATDHFAARYTQEIELDQSGVYRFELQADDEAMLIVDGELVNSVSGDLDVREDSFVALGAGSHTVELRYLEIAGDQTLRLDWFLQEATDNETQAQAWIESTMVPPVAEEDEMPGDQDEDVFEASFA